MTGSPHPFGSAASIARASDPRDQIREKALGIGFDAVGFCQASLGPQARERLTNFLVAGYHGDMGWLAARTEQRSHPQSLWPEAKSVIVVGLSYAPDDDPLAVTTQRSKGAISVYARNRDYHDIIKGKLKHLAQFLVSRFNCELKVFVDTAPVMEKPLAQRSGLGWQGKHTNLVSRSHGSWLLLGEIYTHSEMNRAKRSPIIAAPVRDASIFARPRHFLRLINSMPPAASHISRSNTKAQSPQRLRKAMGNQFTGAMTAWRFALGTSSPSRPPMKAGWAS